MRVLLSNIATTLLLVFSYGNFAAAKDLPVFSAYYDASTNGISGNAERHLIKLDENRYRLNISLEAKVGGVEIGDLEQASEFEWREQQIKPILYQYQTSGVSSDVETVSYNWDAGIALSADEDESWTLQLEGEVLDQLSYQQALAEDVASDIDAEEYSYRLIDGDVIETHRFRLIGEEQITTPLGKLDCLKLERIRDVNNGRSTIIWLAKDWSNLLAKIEQTNPSGLRIELTLTLALVNGETVTPLP